MLSESNGTTDKLSTSRSKYAELYNISQNKVIEWLIESNGADENRYLQEIKVPHKELVKNSTKEKYEDFLLEKDYFDFIDLYVEGQKDKCTLSFTTKEVKNTEVNILYNDPFRDPSFKYAETFYTIAENKIQVYKKDFTIKSSQMSYYKVPKQVTLLFPDNPESEFTNDTHQFDDKMVNRIVLLTVSFNNLTTDDTAYQAFKQETISKF